MVRLISMINRGVRVLSLALLLTLTVGIGPLGCSGYRLVKLDRLITLHIAHADPVAVSPVTGGWNVTLNNGSSYLVENDATINSISRFFARYTTAAEAENTARLLRKVGDRPFLFAAMAAVESGCRSDRTSSKGAQGKWQILPLWKDQPGFEFYRGEDAHSRDELNLRAARKILSICQVRTKGDLWKAVRAYCGKGKAAVAYEKKVRKAYAELVSMRPVNRSVWLFG